MDVTSRSRPAFLTCGGLHLSGCFAREFSSAPPSARGSNVDIFRGSLTNLFVTRLGEQFSSLRMMFSWVSTLVLMGHKFAFHKSHKMRLTPGVSVGFTHTTCFSHTERISDARCHWSIPVDNNSHTTAGNPALDEEPGDHDGLEGEVLILEYLRHNTPAPIVVSTTGRTLFWFRSHATTSIILSRVEMSVTSLRSNWLPCTTSSRWTHCAGLLTSRWRSTGVLQIPQTRSGTPLKRTTNGGGCGRHGGAGETDPELRWGLQRP